MAHRVARPAANDLDEIWYYVAKESGSVEIADRLIDSITNRFLLSPAILTWAVPATTTLALAHGVFR